MRIALEVLAAVVWLIGFLAAFNVLADQRSRSVTILIFAVLWPVALAFALCDVAFALVAGIILTALEKVGLRKVTYAKVYHMNERRD